MGTKYIFLLVSFLLYIQPGDLFAAQANTDWDALLDGIGKFKMDKKIKEKFVALCEENETAVVDGRIDTGGGLYMIMDTPVYSQPGKTKIAELEDKSTVVLMNETAVFDGKEWAKIKFLQISSNTKTAVDIEEGWIEKSHLNQTQHNESVEVGG